MRQERRRCCGTLSSSIPAARSCALSSAPAEPAEPPSHRIGKHPRSLLEEHKTMHLPRIAACRVPTVATLTTVMALAAAWIPAAAALAPPAPAAPAPPPAVSGSAGGAGAGSQPADAPMREAVTLASAGKFKEAIAKLEALRRDPACPPRATALLGAPSTEE